MKARDMYVLGHQENSLGIQIAAFMNRHLLLTSPFSMAANRSKQVHGQLITASSVSAQTQRQKRLFHMLVAK